MTTRGKLPESKIITPGKLKIHGTFSGPGRDLAYRHGDLCKSEELLEPPGECQLAFQTNMAMHGEEWPRSLAQEAFESVMLGCHPV
jgi:hypothetical protein